MLVRRSYRARWGLLESQCVGTYATGMMYLQQTRGAPGSTMRDSYCARSLRMVRIMIMATMHDMTTTTMHEFRMLNQCTCNPCGGAKPQEACPQQPMVQQQQQQSSSCR